MVKRSGKHRNKTKFSVKETKLPTVFGAALGIISVATVLTLLYLTFVRGGEATVSYAFAGMLASIFSVTGLVLSILCLNDHYQPHMLGWMGLLTNGIEALSMAGILYLGMF